MSCWAESFVLDLFAIIAGAMNATSWNSNREGSTTQQHFSAKATCILQETPMPDKELFSTIEWLASKCNVKNDCSEPAHHQLKTLTVLTRVANIVICFELAKINRSSTGAQVYKVWVGSFNDSHAPRLRNHLENPMPSHCWHKNRNWKLNAACQADGLETNAENVTSETLCCNSDQHLCAVTMELKPCCLFHRSCVPENLTNRLVLATFITSHKQIHN